MVRPREGSTTCFDYRWHQGAGWERNTSAGRQRTAGLTLDRTVSGPVADHTETWEKVVRKLRAGTMPPPGLPGPGAEAADTFVALIEDALDRVATSRPYAGRPGVHRLNRAE